MNYDKKNNDTYIEKYSNHMAMDVEIHMFKDDTAMVYAHGFRGNFNDESTKTAQNNVLHFESSKTLGKEFVLIKYKNRQSLIPLSLMNRYEHKVFNLSYTQKTPIFFNTETEKFVVAMDNRVLRDLKENDFREKILKISPDISITKEQILLSYESLDDLYEDKTSIYKNLKELYLQTLLKIYPGEDVIILKYETKENEESYFYPAGHYPPVISKDKIPSHLYSSSNIDFEYLKAKKISDNDFYIYDNHGELLTQENFYFDKEKIKKAKLDENKNNLHLSSYTDNASMLIFPYSDKDWALLSTLKEKIDSIFSDLDTLFLKQKRSQGLDAALTQLTVSNHPLLENPKKPRLKP